MIALKGLGKLGCRTKCSGIGARSELNDVGLIADGTENPMITSRVWVSEPPGPFTVREVGLDQTGGDVGYRRQLFSQNHLFTRPLGFSVAIRAVETVFDLRQLCDRSTRRWIRAGHSRLCHSR